MFKFNKQLISFIVVANLILLATLTSFAGANNTKFVYEENYPSIEKFTKDDIDTMKRERKEIEDVASGKMLLGEGVESESTIIEKSIKGEDSSINSGLITPQFGWTLGATKTHQMLNSSALVILNNDKGMGVSKYFYSPYSIDGAGILTRAGDLPDQIETDYGFINVFGIYAGYVDTFRGHFFDPDTKKNWIGGTSPTAMSRFISHYNNAKYYYWRDRTVSMRELGMALHYLGDLNAPHHATNNTVLPLLSNSTHAKFENWVDNNFSYAAISRTGSYYSPRYYSVMINGVEFEGTLCALNAKYYAKYAATFDENNWKIAARGCIPKTQATMSAVLYRFLKDVGERV